MGEQSHIPMEFDKVRMKLLYINIKKKKKNLWADFSVLSNISTSNNCNRSYQQF